MGGQTQASSHMDAELKNLKIDRSRRSPEPSKWATRWIVAGVLLFLLAGAYSMLSSRLNAAPEVEIAAGEIDQCGRRAARASF